MNSSFYIYVCLFTVSTPFPSDTVSTQASMSNSPSSWNQGAITWCAKMWIAYTCHHMAPFLGAYRNQCVIQRQGLLPCAFKDQRWCCQSTLFLSAPRNEMKNLNIQPFLNAFNKTWGLHTLHYPASLFNISRDKLQRLLAPFLDAFRHAAWVSALAGMTCQLHLTLLQTCWHKKRMQERTPRAQCPSSKQLMNNLRRGTDHYAHLCHSMTLYLSWSMWKHPLMASI